MSKRNEIESAVRQIINHTGVAYLFSENQIQKIVDRLEQQRDSRYTRVNSEDVKSAITGDIIVKSLVDFGDTDFWIDQIVDIINNK